VPPVNLYSDTQTRPTEGMRAAIAAAVVGDEQRGLDPTTSALEERVASLLASSIRSVLEVARRHGLRAHLDGARLLNAAVASGVSAAEYAGGFDTAWLDFTKGLGAPVGAVLAGSRELIDEAWRWKQMLGGAFRQSGIVAAGCLYALDHHVERLADDHSNARLLADGLAALPGVRIDPGTVETNIVLFDVDDARGLVARIAERVELSAFGAHRVRAVTHLDVSRADIELALEAFAQELG
jgi:threonine aldolase